MPDFKFGIVGSQFLALNSLISGYLQYKLFLEESRVT
jgi:hypothetical protein